MHIVLISNCDFINRYGHEIAIELYIYMSYGHVASYVYIDNGETNSNNMYGGGNPYLRIAISRLEVCNIMLTCIYYNLCLLVSLTCSRDTTQTILH